MTEARQPIEGVDLATARAALESVVPRLVALIRTIRDPDAHAVGEWSAGDVAVHLAGAWDALPALARGDLASPIRELSELGALTTGMVRGTEDRDHVAAARRIECSADKFLQLSAHAAGDETAPWLIEGVELPLRTFACHLLSESLVHGDDIARAERRPWTITPDHAAIALMGFVTPVAARLDPRSLVAQERAAGVDACYGLDLRGRGRLFLTIAGGELTTGTQANRRVDCHISADPAAMLLLLFGRRGVWSVLRTGGMLAWGRRPWLAPRLRTMLRNP